jgi:ubiquinone/menaquinone biosynthesis C-methylase UbiE
MTTIKSLDLDFIHEVNDVKASNLRKYLTKNPIKRYSIKRFLSTILTELNNLNPDSVLDLGGGEGIVARLIHEKLDIKHIDIVDISSTSLNLAGKWTDSQRILADVYNLPFYTKSYDVVICLEVLEHLDNPLRALKEIKRIASSGIIITVPNTMFFRLGNLLSLKNLKNLGEDIDHKKSFNTRKFEKLLQKEFDHIKMFNNVFWLIGTGKM